MTHEHLLAYGYIALVAFLLSNAVVPMARRAALALGILDHPGAHKTHREPTPLLGGVAVFVVLLLVIGGHLAALPELHHSGLVPHIFPHGLDTFDPMGLTRSTFGMMLAGSTIVLLTGLADDATGPHFPAWMKLAGQVLAAALVITAGVRFPLFDAHPWLATGATLMWIVGITNSINLLDNMDGLATGVALICSSLLWLIAATLGEIPLGLVLAALVGTLAGFLRYNFHPARIFLGDAGSLTIGYVIGVLAILTSSAARQETVPNEWFGPVMPVLVLGLPIYDTASVIWIRWREGRPIYRGDRSHLSHRLVELGMTEREAVGTIYLLTFCLGASALLIREATPMLTLLAVGQAAALVAVTTALMSVPRRTRGVSVSPRPERAEASGQSSTAEG
jgi:UDP-GlcNAc:undecaprenyl-phosphate GlcNAc-1-phosphate transferase